MVRGESKADDTRKQPCTLGPRKLMKRTWIAILVVAASLPVPVAHAREAPASCVVGTYVISLYDFDLSGDSFSADFWFWSTCDADLRPLDVMDFPTAKHVVKTLAATSKRGGKYWSYVKVSGVFRYDWDIRNFPFDRHDLLFEIEHTAAPASAFRYMPDRMGSKVNREIALNRWEITDFHIDDYVYVYDTAFGDPAFKDKQVSDYARMTIGASIERRKVIGFFKLTAGVFVSFAFAMLSFFLGAETGSRTGLLVGTLFAVLVNQRVAEAVLGRVEAFTLVDQIHVIAMVFIFAAAFGALLNRTLNHRGHAELAMTVDRIGAVGSGLLYCAVNGWVIWIAAVAG